MRARPLDRARLLTAAAFALALGLQFHDGRLGPFGLAFVAASLVLCGRALDRRAPAPPAFPVDAPIDRPLRVAVAAALATGLARPPGANLDVHGVGARLPFLAGLVAAGALLELSFRARESDPSGCHRRAVGGLLVLHLVLGAWVIRHSPHPAIDVVTIQRDALRALSAGHNPYTLTFQNIYGDNSPFYAPGLSVSGRLQVGFPYPPLSLLLALPTEWVGADFRYAGLVAMTAGGALIAFTRGGRVGLGAAALYLFSPRSFFVLEQGWTEPYVLAALALVVFCACRFRAGLGVALGLFFASKQYAILATPLLPLLAPPGQQARLRRRWLLSLAAPAAAVVAALTLPFAVCAPRAFFRDVVALLFEQPFRNDALSFLGAFAYLTGRRLPGACGLVAAALASWFAWRRCRRTPADFAAATAFVAFAFFAFNKQAFCNYYTFVVGALCIALGAAEEPVPEGAVRHSRPVASRTSSRVPSATR